jgi:predicted DNA binding CopG/RHH family protein
MAESRKRGATTQIVPDEDDELVAVTLRLAQHELNAMRQRADAEGLSVAAWIHAQLRRAADLGG